MDSSSHPTPQLRSPEQAADEVIALFKSPIAQGNHGEVVPQIDHALQAAQLARKANARDGEVLAALLHDVGHFCAPDENGSVEGIGVADHDDVGAGYLRGLGFSEAVIDIVEGHVDAKRYLVSRDERYTGRLSGVSTRSLEAQGGAMTSEEATNFEKTTRFEEKIRVRAWDEQAKVPGAQVEPIEGYRGLLVRDLSRTSA